jgi:hypothetical protein
MRGCVEVGAEVFMRTMAGSTGRELLRGMVSGEFPHEKLKEESDALTLRLHLPADDSVIVKLWQRPGLRGVLRRLTRTDPASREHHALEHLHRSGIPVPLPLGISRIEIAGLPFTDAFFLQDLGPCQTALHHLQLLIRAGHERAVAGFLDEVVELTAAVVEARVIDTDHHLTRGASYASTQSLPARIEVRPPGPTARCSAGSSAASCSPYSPKSSGRSGSRSR